MQRMQKMSPHFLQWYCKVNLIKIDLFSPIRKLNHEKERKVLFTFRLKWSKGVEQLHSVMFLSVFQSTATDSRSLVISSTCWELVTHTEFCSLSVFVSFCLSGWSSSADSNSRILFAFSYKYLLSRTFMFSGIVLFFFSLFFFRSVEVLMKDFTEEIRWNGNKYCYKCGIGWIIALGTK